jgi:hypothetical protein
MKKILLLLLIISVIFLFQGCSSDYSNATSSEIGKTNQDFQLWLSSFPSDPIEGVEYWNAIESKKGWTFSWTIKADNAFEVWLHKEWNCSTGVIVWLELYPECDWHRIEQPEFDHVVILYKNYIISFSGLEGEVFDGWHNYPYYQKGGLQAENEY